MGMMPPAGPPIGGGLPMGGPPMPPKPPVPPAPNAKKKPSAAGLKNKALAAKLGGKKPGGK